MVKKIKREEKLRGRNAVAQLIGISRMTLSRWAKLLRIPFEERWNTTYDKLVSVQAIIDWLKELSVLDQLKYTKLRRYIYNAKCYVENASR